MIKKLLTGCLVVVVLLLSYISLCADNMPVESEQVKIIIDGKLCTYDDVPININGRLLLPIRAVAVSLGVPDDSNHIVWDDSTKSAKIYYGDIELHIEINNRVAKVNGIPVDFEVAPVIYKNKTYVPLRLIAESFNRKIHWDGNLKAAYITTQKEFDKVKDLVERTNNATADIKRGRITTKMDIQILQQNSSLALNVDMLTEFDRHDRKLHVKIDVPVMGNLSLDTYFVDNILYERNLLTNKWEKKSFDSGIADILFEDNVDIVSLVNSDTICAGMVVEQDSSSDMFILKGSVYLAELFNKVNEYTSEIFHYELDSYNTIVYIDKKSLVINKMIMEISGKLDSDLGNDEYIAEIVCMFHDINKDVKIVLPEGV